MNETNTCKLCSGSGLLHFSFEAPKPCWECSGGGKIIPKGHTQIIHFVGGYKRTIRDIIAVWENEYLHIQTRNGDEWIINKSNILCCEKLTGK
jgi:hypothetical protein